MGGGDQGKTTLNPNAWQKGGPRSPFFCVTELNFPRTRVRRDEINVKSCHWRESAILQEANI